MSTSEDFWKSLPDGFFLGFTKHVLNGEHVFGQAFDPQTDQDVTLNLYGDMSGNGDFAVTVVHVRRENDVIVTSDVSEKFRKDMETYLKERGDEVPAPLPAAGFSSPFLTHVALWADGELGTLCEWARADQQEDVLHRANAYMRLHGDKPANEGLVGVIFLVDPGEGKWLIQDIGETPAPEHNLTHRMDI